MIRIEVNLVRKFVWLHMALFALASTAKADVPDVVQVSGLNYHGPGCPSGTARAVISPDRQSFTVIFDRFTAGSTSGSASGRATSSCSLIADLSYPDGWQLTIATVDFRGFAAVDTEAWAKVTARFRFRGAGFQRPAQLTIIGPWVSDFLLHEERGSGREWSPCHRSSSRDLFVDASLQTHAQGSRYAYLSMDSIDGQARSLRHTYYVQWRRCV